jgi:hypothetical protein
VEFFPMSYLWLSLTHCFPSSDTEFPRLLIVSHTRCCGRIDAGDESILIEEFKPQLQ